ncbi:hypothetical protein THER_1603 [Thermodesulfovibrio sp. N1]|nr:hypothetical protein THER_1603 [Thermodesulfovibrio sp. N1]
MPSLIVPQFLHLKIAILPPPINYFKIILNKNCFNVKSN